MRNIALFLLSIALFGCSEEKSDLSLDQGYDFLPLQVGMFWTYSVEETVYEVFEPITTTYILKEVIADSLVSAGNEMKYVVNRYSGVDEDNLELDSVWSIRKTERSAITGENNKEVIKLSFPVTSGISWDGNAYNTQDAQLFYYQDIDIYEFDGDSYSSPDAIRVIIEDIEQNLVNQDERSEVYLRNIGLVEKDYTELSFCTVNCDQKGSEIGAIEKGKILKQNLISYGKE
ncbi:MAG: hypothetical protein CMB80_33885 [Flammeovirgaceae bacterium]|nr:hypothetical protein [Flammeovirgaceae bacterium]HCX21547.1 hypothetical protein [Cytophagales bacterium]